MELSYEYVLNWFEGYFKDVRNYQGDLKTVPKLKRFFSPDMELSMYTALTSPPKKIMTRDALLISFVHPGLQEDITPNYLVVDLKQLIVVVQFEIRFRDKPSGKKWDPLQASAHYHLIVDENKELKIRKIHYWTEPLPKDVFEYWTRYREEALMKHATNYFNDFN